MYLERLVEQLLSMGDNLKNSISKTLLYFGIQILKFLKFKNFPESAFFPDIGFSWNLSLREMNDLQAKLPIISLWPMVKIKAHGTG